MTKIIAVMVLALAACGETEELRQAQRDRAAAENQAREAEQAAEEAIRKVEKLEHDMTDLDKRTTAATDAVVKAQTDSDRDAAKTKLDALRKERAKFELQMAEAKAAAAKAKRIRGRSISQECRDNPLARGCD